MRARRRLLRAALCERRLRQPLQASARLAWRTAQSAACTSSSGPCLRARRRRCCTWCKSTRCVWQSVLLHVSRPAACAHRAYGRRATARRWWWSSPTETGDTPRGRWSATTACGGCVQPPHLPARRAPDGATRACPQQCLALPLLAALHERLTKAEFDAVDVIAVDEVRQWNSAALAAASERCCWQRRRNSFRT